VAHRHVCRCLAGFWWVACRLAAAGKLTKCVVFTNGSDDLILCNSSIQLTIAKGRITSLFDVPQKYVTLVIKM
jgi:hypothetical protein